MNLNLTEADVARISTCKLNKEYGYNITKVTTDTSAALKYTIIKQ
jgi:hypothetical protein